MDLANNGDVFAQGTVGDMYTNGQCVEQSYETAVEWFRKAAEQGYYLSEFFMAKCYETGDGVEDLLAVCEKYAVEGPFLFPEDVTTDQPERQVMAEIIREKLLWCLDREVPHGTAVEISRFSERENGIIDIDAVIYCEKASHKGIIIGKNGQMLKKISSMARSDCEKFMGTKVYLTTWVKVKENWRDSDFLVRNFGYSE